LRALLVTLAVLLLSSSPRVASADTMGLLVLGDILQKPTREMADKWLRAHGQTPQSNPLPTDSIKILQDCFVVDDPRCATSVIDSRAATDNVVAIRVEIASKKEKDIRLTIDWFTKKRAPITARRTCENCTENLLRTTLDAMLTDLAKQKPGMVGRIKITSEPPGIPVLFDNETLGVTPIERDVAVGSHKARLIRDGRMGAEKDVEVKPGATAEVTLEAPAAGVIETPLPNGPERHSRVLPGLMIGTGVAAIGAGAVMAFVLHKEPDLNTHFSKDYKTPGMITAGAGAVVAITGLIIILATPNHEGPTVSPTGDGGATIGWIGRF
jgi:hypothetical protein